MTISIRSDQDPALFDEDLQRKLNENRRIGMSRLDEVCLVLNMIMNHILERTTLMESSS